MRSKSRWKILAIAMSLAVACFVFIGCSDKDEKADMPEEVKKVRLEVTDHAKKWGDELSGKWGDDYAALIKSGEARDHADYAAMSAKMEEIKKETGARYVYILSPTDEANKDAKGGTILEPKLDGYLEGPFVITVDGADPDDWGYAYDFEPQFKDAWEGKVITAGSAWDDSDGADPTWSGFAPIKDSEGNVVALLGIDYPAPAVEDFPQWNRDRDDFDKELTESFYGEIKK